jgi:5-methyltetrahydropteroyltriglutamate--homocysteine methyltransferase
VPDPIRTTHVGSLPRPNDLVELNHARARGDGADEAGYERALAAAVTDVVARQRAAGVDVVNDGEYGHSMGHRYDYGAWWAYIFQRLGGLALHENLWDLPSAPPQPGELSLAGWDQRRDFVQFREAYEDPESGASGPSPDLEAGIPVCEAPITYVGHDAVAQDIAHLRAALDAAGLETGYLNAVAPGSCARFGNAHYDTEEELIYACADAMREEYQAIIDAGLLLQIDDPALAENWDQINPAPSVADYERFAMVRVEALNHALRGLPPERIRFHLCWGSWHGPHVTDLPLADIVGVMLRVNAGAYSFEAANARHEHEWKVWQDVDLPDDKLLLPGVVGHSTNVVEHPELVADRLERFARIVGPERVIGSTDCGLGGRVHPQIAWAKLEALAQGAELAGRRL